MQLTIIFLFTNLANIVAVRRFVGLGGPTLGMTLDLNPSQALRVLHDMHIQLVNDGRVDLSTRQLAILFSVYLDPPPHTVRGLAARLGVSKPVISRALDSMGQLGLLERKRDESDRRNVLVQRTVPGALYIDYMAGLMIERSRGFMS